MFNRIREEKGFTLIELLVVILIIGILIAVAAPSFLGQQEKARVSGVKQNLTVVYKSAKADAVDFNEAGDYRSSADTILAVGSSEPQLADDLVVLGTSETTVAAGDLGVRTAGRTLTAAGATNKTDVLLVADDTNGVVVTDTAK